jgi:hypothetical protein
VTDNISTKAVVIEKREVGYIYGGGDSDYFLKLSSDLFSMEISVGKIMFDSVDTGNKLEVTIKKVEN